MQVLYILNNKTHKTSINTNYHTKRPIIFAIGTVDEGHWNLMSVLEHESEYEHEHEPTNVSELKPDSQSNANINTGSSPNSGSSFKLPIFYLKSKEKLDKNITDDLELLKLNDTTEERKPLLNTIFVPTSKIGKLNLHKQLEYFTTDKLFLKQTQKIVKAWKEDTTNREPRTEQQTKSQQYDAFYDLWESLKQDPTFIDRYYYVDV